MDQINNGAKTQDAPPFPLAIAKVQQKVEVFHDKMRRILFFLQLNGAPPDLIIDIKELLIQVHIDKAGIQRLVNISNQHDFDTMGVFFGLEDTLTQEPWDATKHHGFGRITTCFVGLDKNKKILPVHFPAPGNTTAAVEAEDTWPPPPPPPDHGYGELTLLSSPNEVSGYFAL